MNVHGPAQVPRVYGDSIFQQLIGRCCSWFWAVSRFSPVGPWIASAGIYRNHVTSVSHWYKSNEQRPLAYRISKRVLSYSNVSERRSWFIHCLLFIDQCWRRRPYRQRCSASIKFPTFCRIWLQFPVTRNTPALPFPGKNWPGAPGHRHTSFRKVSFARNRGDIKDQKNVTCFLQPATGILGQCKAILSLYS
jgi:hypothetical protein